MIKTKALLLCLLLAAARAHASVDTAEIERRIQDMMAAQNIPAVAVSVALNGQIEWSNAYGLIDLEYKTPAKVDTVFRIGSVSKAITAIAAMSLVEGGLLDLGKEVKEYVPAWPDKPWPLTVEPLLSHLGGIRHYKDNSEIQVTRHYSSLVDALDIFKSDPILKPGRYYLYSSFGYNLLGAVMEAAAGKPFMEVVRERVLVPAGMNDTRDDDLSAIVPNRAPAGYAKDASGRLRNAHLLDSSYKIPSGGLVSTTQDLARFAIAVLSDKLVSHTTFDRMTTVARLENGNLNTGSYGMGWYLGTRNGRREVFHTGGQSRINAVLYMLPDQRAAIVLLCNLEGARMIDLARAIGDLIN